MSVAARFYDTLRDIFMPMILHYIQYHRYQNCYVPPVSGIADRWFLLFFIRFPAAILMIFDYCRRGKAFFQCRHAAEAFFDAQTLYSIPFSYAFTPFFFVRKIF